MPLPVNEDYDGNVVESENVIGYEMPLHVKAQEWVQAQVYLFWLTTCMCIGIPVGFLLGSYRYCLVFVSVFNLTQQVIPDLNFNLFFARHRVLRWFTYINLQLNSFLTVYFISPLWWIQMATTQVTMIYSAQTVVAEKNGRGETVTGGAYLLSQGMCMALFNGSAGWAVFLSFGAVENPHAVSWFDKMKYIVMASVYGITSIAIIHVIAFQATRRTSESEAVFACINLYVFGHAFSYVFRSFLPPPGEVYNVMFLRSFGIGTLTVQALLLIFKHTIRRFIKMSYAYKARQFVARELSKHFVSGKLQKRDKNPSAMRGTSLTCAREVPLHDITMVPASSGNIDFFVVYDDNGSTAKRITLALQIVTTEYVKKTGKDPSFCVTSSTVTDIIMSPVHAADCKQTLILLTHTLLQSPCGVLKLFAALAVHQNIVIIPLGGYLRSTSTQLVADIAKFDVRDLLEVESTSGIYELLLKVTASYGVDSFNKMIKTMVTGTDISKAISTTKFDEDGVITLMSAGVSTTVELNIALHDILDVGGAKDDLILKLIRLGAQASSRRPQTLQLPHYIVMGRVDPNQCVLDRLFEAHFEIDSQIGYAIKTKAQMSLLQGVILRLIKRGWRRKEDHATVLHCIVESCRANHITDQSATYLARFALDIDASLHFIANCHKVTPGHLAVQCEHAVELERLLTLVVFDSYQLIAPGSQLYKSSTALVVDCNDLSLANTSNLPTVLKLMSDFHSWKREIDIRQILQTSTDCIVDVLSAATVDANAPHIIGRIPVRHSRRVNQDAAVDIVKKYPYALLLQKADRSLLEIIANERLAAEPLHIVRNVALKLGRGLMSLHSRGIVHGDVKPRNVVRTEGSELRFIDFDMSFSVQRSSSSASTYEHHIQPDKVLATSAYVAPELLHWVEDARDQTNYFHLKMGVGLDIWSFGMLLYEVSNGATLLKSAYDRANHGGLSRLRNWNGLQPEDLKRVRQRHRNDIDCLALVDILEWTLSKDATDRPASISDILSHTFFDPIRGKMREIFVVREIRNMLQIPRQRPLVKTMISYCNEDKSFVLDKLCLTLAPLVQDLAVNVLGATPWTKQSAHDAVFSSEVIVAVVSSHYVKSDNCGFEMELAQTYGKTIIPLCFDFPFDQWPPVKIGNVEMISQFSNRLTGDGKLFIDFSNPEDFHVKFEQELRHRLAKDALRQTVI